MLYVEMIFMKFDNAGRSFSFALNSMSKRENYINWDEYFMGIALLSAQRSKDPNSQVGACIVSQDNKILSIGYNGFPVRVFR